MTPPADLLAAALDYAARGWPVFPCHPMTKQPLVKKGFKEATTDAAQIRAWWAKWPNALIACPTGAAIGAFIVDLDIGSPVLIAGTTYLHRFSAHVAGTEGLPHTAIAETASGGIHVYFAWDPARPVGRVIRACPALAILQPEGTDPPPGSKKPKAAGIDVLGEDGYAIVPPSVRADGKAWTWLQEPKDGVAPAPEGVMRIALKLERDGSHGSAGAAESISARASAAVAAPRAKRTDLDERQRRYALRAFDDEVRSVSAAPAGQRNDALFKAAAALGSLIGAGALSETTVTAALEEAARECGLWSDDGPKSVRDTIQSGLKTGKGSPRSLPQSGRGPPSRAASAPAPPPDDGRPATRGSRGPADKPAEGGAGEPPQDGNEISAETLDQLAGEPLNDLGNARRLIGYFGGDMIHVRAIGVHAWVGTHWQAEGGDEAAMRWAHITSERIALESPLLPHTKHELDAIAADEALSKEDRALALGRGAKGAVPLLDGQDEEAVAERREQVRDIIAAGKAARGALRSRQQKRRQFSIASGNGGRLAAMVQQAKPYITVLPEEIDRDPVAINLRSGTLRVVKTKVPDPECPDPAVERLKTVYSIRLDPHRREDRLAKLMPADYDPTATAPKWLAFLERFQPNPAPRRFLQQFHGYALTGLMGEQVFVFNYGSGANGKSTFMEAVARLMGAYAQVLPAEALSGDMQRRGDQATPEFARLPGARLVRAAELPRGQSFRESTIKMLTGGEKMLVRHLHERFFEFQPTFKAIGSGNDKPLIGGVDEGIWRRMKLVPWPVTIPAEERRPMERVLRDFEAERAGILNWLLEGLLDYLENGLVTPDEITSATADYRAQMDHVSEFTGACVVASPGTNVTARAMFEAYTAWCHANSVKAYSERRFSDTMGTKGFKKELGRIRQYLDVRLNNVPQDPDKARQERLDMDM